MQGQVAYFIFRVWFFAHEQHPTLQHPAAPWNSGTNLIECP
jgi:hypothetical protein